MVINMELKLKNTIVKVEYSFFLLLSFAVLYGYEYSLRLILFSLIHEAGHLLSLILLGIQPKEITFSFYGIGLKYLQALPKKKEMIVLLCGPIANFILFLILNDEINLFLFILNSYPVFPLDGGRIFNIIFPKKSKLISDIFLALLIFASIALIVYFNAYSLLFISIYLLIFNIGNRYYRGHYEKMC